MHHLCARSPASSVAKNDVDKDDNGGGARHRRWCNLASAAGSTSMSEAKRLLPPAQCRSKRSRFITLVHACNTRKGWRQQRSSGYRLLMPGSSRWRSRCESGSSRRPAPQVQSSEFSTRTSPTQERSVEEQRCSTHAVTDARV